MYALHSIGQTKKFGYDAIQYQYNTVGNVRAVVCAVEVTLEHHRVNASAWLLSCSTEDQLSYVRVLKSYCPQTTALKKFEDFSLDLRDAVFQLAKSQVAFVKGESTTGHLPQHQKADDSGSCLLLSLWQLTPDWSEFTLALHYSAVARSITPHWLSAPMCMGLHGEVPSAHDGTCTAPSPIGDSHVVVQTWAAVNTFLRNRLTFPKKNPSVDLLASRPGVLFVLGAGVTTSPGGFPGVFHQVEHVGAFVKTAKSQNDNTLVVDFLVANWGALGLESSPDEAVYGHADAPSEVRISRSRSSGGVTSGSGQVEADNKLKGRVGLWVDHVSAGCEQAKAIAYFVGFGASHRNGGPGRTLCKQAAKLCREHKLELVFVTDLSLDKVLKNFCEYVLGNTCLSDVQKVFFECRPFSFVRTIFDFPRELPRQPSSAALPSSSVCTIFDFPRELSRQPSSADLREIARGAAANCLSYVDSSSDPAIRAKQVAEGKSGYRKGKGRANQLTPLYLNELSLGLCMVADQIELAASPPEQVRFRVARASVCVCLVLSETCLT